MQATDCLSNNICELYENYFEKRVHEYATQMNQNSMKLPKVKLQTGRKGFYLIAAKHLMHYPPEARTIKYKTVFRKSLEEHFELTHYPNDFL